MANKGKKMGDGAARQWCGVGSGSLRTLGGHPLMPQAPRRADEGDYWSWDHRGTCSLARLTPSRWPRVSGSRVLNPKQSAGKLVRHREVLQGKNTC